MAAEKFEYLEEFAKQAVNRVLTKSSHVFDIEDLIREMIRISGDHYDDVQETMFDEDGRLFLASYLNSRLDIQAANIGKPAVWKRGRNNFPKPLKRPQS